MVVVDGGRMMVVVVVEGRMMVLVGERFGGVGWEDVLLGEGKCQKGGRGSVV